MTNLVITVVIPARNAANTIDRAIKSALSAGADKVLIYDDASTDKTGDYLETIFDRCPNMQYWRGDSVRAGVVYARNFLIARAPYDSLIVPLDADDELKTLQPFRDHWQEGTWLYGSLLEVGKNKADVLRELTCSAPGMLDKHPLCYATMCFHKKDWTKVNGYDPDLNLGAEDYGLQCALTAAGVKPVRIPDVIYYRYVQESRRTEIAKQYWPTLYDVIRNKWRVGV